jgi:lipoprotein Spr
VNKFFKISLLLISITGIIILSGCSATTSTLRKEDKDTKVDNNYPRYEQNTQPTVVNDTSAINDDEDLADYKGDSINVDVTQILKKYSTNTQPGNNSVTPQEKMLMEIIKYKDTPYKYGGNSKEGIDCSAFTQSVFNNCFSISLLRSAHDQYTQGTEVSEKSDLKFGDLVFFNTRRRVKPGHVGIYIGDNCFAHSSSSEGVKVSSLEEDYYSRKFMGGRRISNIFNSK